MSELAVAQSASNSAAAQALFEQARTLMAEGKASEACPKLEESQRLDPGTGTLLNLARCYEESGRVASAWNKYLEAAAAAHAAGQKAREKEARKRADALRPKLSQLTIQVAPEAGQTPGLVVLRDGEPVGAAQWGVPIPADAGDHVVIASAPGRADYRVEVAVRDGGEIIQVAVPALEPATSAATPPVHAAAAPAPGPSAELAGDLERARATRRTIALVSAGVGVIGLGIGTAFGLKSKSHHDEAERYCDGSACTDPRGIAAGEDAYAAGNVSTVAMIVGALGVGAGIALWVTAPGAAPATTQVGVGAGSVQLRGAF